MKPKLWNGPDAVGEARARFNETIDVPYATASGPGFRADKKVGLSEVFLDRPVLDEAELVLFADGYAGTKYKRKGSERIGGSFYPSRRELHYWNLGDGFGCDVYTNAARVDEYIPIYPKRDGTGSYTALFHHYGTAHNPRVFKKSLLKAFVAPLRTPRITMSPVGESLYALTPLGKTNADKGRFLFFVPNNSGVTDDWGFETSKITCYSVSDGGMVVANALLPVPLGTIGERDYILGPAFNLGPTSAAVFVGQFSHVAQEVPGGDLLATRTNQEARADGQGGIFLYKTDDSGDTWTITRFPSLDFIVAYDSGSEPFLGFQFYDVRPAYWACVPGDIYNGNQGLRISDFCMTSEIVVFTPSIWVVFCVVTDGRYLDGTLRTRATFSFRTDDAGATWSQVNTPITGMDEGADADPYLFDTVILRPGVALSRAVFGATGIDRPVTWLRSMDSGVTWAAVTATGLPETDNQFIGYLKVLRVFEVDGKTLIGLSCWSELDSAYVMYLSEDDGVTWVKSRKIQTAPYFRRVDRDKISNPTNDGKGNFGALDYVGSSKRRIPLDVAQPWRYDSSVLPPQ